VSKNCHVRHPQVSEKINNALNSIRLRRTKIQFPAPGGDYNFPTDTPLLAAGWLINFQDGTFNIKIWYNAVLFLPFFRYIGCDPAIV
jgi:hypothetical protein